MTTTPASVLRRPDSADVAVGSTGDATVMRIEEEQFTFIDVLDQTCTGLPRFALDSVVVAGKLWHQADAGALAAD